MTLILAKAIEVYSYILLASVIVSWLPIDRNNPAIKLLEALTEPILAPIRKVISPQMTGGLDFSPMVAYFGLTALANLALRF